jgi:hypothetical protein
MKWGTQSKQQSRVRVMKTLNILLFLITALGGSDVFAGNRTIIINGGDVERLYAITNNPANANATVVLRPGTYTLTAIDPSGGARPRGGGLMLQEGMTLLGSNTYTDADHDGVWDATLEGDPVTSGATVVDGTGLVPYAPSDGNPETDCTGYADTDLFRTLVIAYRNRSTISRLSILAGPGAIALTMADSAYLPATGFVAEISNNFLDVRDNAFGGGFGAVFANLGCRMRNATSTLLFNHNIVRGSRVGGVNADLGLAVINGLTGQAGDVRSGPRLNAIIKNNHFIGNSWGLHSRNTLGVDGGWINIFSTGNLFDWNYAGIEATAGSDFFSPTGANGNQYDLLSYRDVFRLDVVGVLGLGAWRYNLDTNSGTSNNQLRIALTEDRFEGGDAAHIWSTFPEPRYGIDRGNRVTATVRGSVLSGVPLPPFLFIDPVQGDSNDIDIVGSDATFLQSNGALPIRRPNLAPINAFDLVGVANALHFVPNAYGYSVTAGAGTLDPDIGALLDFSGLPNGVAPLDDDTIEVALPFVFAFEGKVYSSLWVNTDGNVTFGSGDFLSTPRDVKRMISGPPRIAPLFADLSIAAGGSIHANVYQDRATITWVDVPSWENGLADQNTCQIVLHSDGSIDLIYGAVGLTEAVVGISSGDITGSAPISVDLSLQPGGVAAQTIYEFFTSFFQGP